jgi:hypothetical protein
MHLVRPAGVSLFSVLFLVIFGASSVGAQTIAFQRIDLPPFDGGHGVFWSDVTDDFRPDLYVTRNVRNPNLGEPGNPQPSNLVVPQFFFVNILPFPTFPEVGAGRGIANANFGTHGAVWADLDNDGDYDLVTGNTYNAAFFTTEPPCGFTSVGYDCPNHNAELRIYRNNNGGGSFQDVTPANVAARKASTRAVLALDWDRDGDLDLLGTNGFNGADNQIPPFTDDNLVFRNDGGFAFTEMTGSALFSARIGQGAAAVDFDNDGDVDVLVPGGSFNPMRVLRNDGAGNFENLPANLFGFADTVYSGVTAGDVDNDGDLDVIVIRSLAAYDDRASLYHNTGDGFFARVQDFGLVNGFGASLGDLDNDGDLDLLFPGHSRVWVNPGNGLFAPGPSLGLPDQSNIRDWDPRSIAFADADGDGDLDFAQADKFQPSFLMRNNTAGAGNHLRVLLRSPSGTAGAFNAKVRVYRAGHLGGKLLAYREAQGSYGYLSQDEPILHVGLGNVPSVDIEVEYLGGSRQVLLNQPANSAAIFDGANADPNGNGVPDSWELYYFGGATNPAGDPDGDGLTTAQEIAAGSHPNGPEANRRFLAEGAKGFFATHVALANPGGAPAKAVLTFTTDTLQVVRKPVVIAPQSMTRVDVRTVSGISGVAFSTIVDTDVPLVVDRRMEWGAGLYSMSAERAIASPSGSWHFAEGATGPFNLFYLIQNPTGAPVQVNATYFRAHGAPPLAKTYSVPALSRFSIWVNLETFDGFSGHPLQVGEISASFSSLSPVIVERAMYLDTYGLPLGVGHASAGVTTASQDWFLAEGATGDWFDEFILLSNPNLQHATVDIAYLLEGGTTISKQYQVEPRSRRTIWVGEGAEERSDARLFNVSLSARIHSTVPIVAERSMWWPFNGAFWYEAHAALGTTGARQTWAVADGEVSTDARMTQTYLLVANVTGAPVDVTVTLLFEDGGTATRTYAAVPANSRHNVAIAQQFPQALGRRFGAIVQSSVANSIVVERAVYSNSPGQVIGAGGAALATPIP